MWGRVQNDDMASLDRHLYAWDEKNTELPRIGEKVLIEGHALVVGDGKDVEALTRCFRDKLSCRVSHPVEGIVGRMEVKVNFKGSWSSFYFVHANGFFHYPLSSPSGYNIKCKMYQIACQLAYQPGAQGFGFLKRPEISEINRACGRVLELFDYFFGYPTVWERVIFWSGRRPITFAKAGLSMCARTTVAKPSEAQYR